jgi:hypothetical protein
MRAASTRPRRAPKRSGDEDDAPAPPPKRKAGAKRQPQPPPPAAAVVVQAPTPPVKNRKEVLAEERRAAAAATGCATTIRIQSQPLLEDFYRYLYRRMCVRVQMHGDETVLGKHVPPPPQDHILELVTSGNAYRHLDKSDHEEGALFRRLAGIISTDQVTASQFESVLMMCLVRMSGMNEQRMMEWSSQLPSGKRGELHGVVDAIPSNEEEALHLADYLTHVGYYARKPSMFAGAGFQVQGARRWADALRTWFGVPALDQQKYPSGKQWTLAQVAAEVRAAKTWEEANGLVQKLAPVGSYTGAQALCTLLYGVFDGEASRCFGPAFDERSMVDYCAPGTGPGVSCAKIFGINETAPKEVLAAINWLRTNADSQFKALGLAFPYLSRSRSWESHRRELTCVDFEHSLCYFSRLINIRRGLGEDGSKRLYDAVIGEIRAKRLKMWKIKALANHCHGKHPPPPDLIVDNILATLALPD